MEKEIIKKRIEVKVAEELTELVELDIFENKEKFVININKNSKKLVPLK